jgi:adenine-specific DNA-methyltransferase
MQNLYNELINLLQEDQALIVDDKLNKGLIIDRALKLDPALIRLLLTHEKIKKQFFVDIDGIMVFDKIAFQRFVNTKKFLEDSYTQYKNKIGLSTDNENYLTDSKEVVLVWPHKDCILEGGQTKDDAKRNEIFYNTTLAPDEIDVLTAPKVLTNWKRYDKDGETVPTTISKQDNLIIKGNNLLALHTLKEKYRGQIKLIYIDPPYNPETNSNTFAYNNSFNKSTWLTFIKNRLEVAKQLLTLDGAIIIAIDENEFLELGILIKEIFDTYDLHCITIVHNPRGVQGTNFSYTNEYAFFVLPKGKKVIGNRKIDEKEIEWSNLRNWGSESERKDAKNCFYPIIANRETLEIIEFGDVCDDDFNPSSINEFEGDTIRIYPIDGKGIQRKWRYARQSVDEIRNLLRVRLKNGVYDVELGKDFGMYKTVWIDNRYDANQYGTQIVNDLVSNNIFKFPKSLWNVYDCLYSVVGIDKNAIILDFFGGSGTTAHAVLELNKDDEGNRKFIICEQMNYINIVTVARIQKVINDNGKGGFVYAELCKSNQQYIDDIQAATTKETLQTLWLQIQETAFISYKVLPEKINASIKEFEVLSFEEQQQFLIEVLDKNLLYVNKTEMNDTRHKVSDYDKEMTGKFYGM